MCALLAVSAYKIGAVIGKVGVHKSNRCLINIHVLNLVFFISIQGIIIVTYVLYEKNHVHGEDIELEDQVRKLKYRFAIEIEMLVAVVFRFYLDLFLLFLLLKFTVPQNDGI